MGKIVHRYLLREVLTPFLLGLSIFTFVLLVARLLKLIELVVNRGLPATTVLKLFAYILPAFLEVSVPMAMLLAILIAFGRLSADSEMIALRSSGLSLYQLLPPITAFVLFATIATALLSFNARPWGNRSLKTALFDIARTRAVAGLRSQVFNDDFPGLVIYTEGIERSGDRLQHVLISDERDPQQHNTILAREGLMISDSKAQTVTLRLLDGWMHTSDPTSKAEYHTEFQSYDVNLDLRLAYAGLRREQDAKEMTLGQLQRAMARKQAAGQSYEPELVEYHRKFSIPFACVVFGLVAIPLGVQPTRSARSHGFAVSLILIFLYYILLSAGQGLAEHALVPAVIGLWLPNAALGILGLVLFRRAGRERTVLPLDWIDTLVAFVRRRLAGPLGAEAHP